MLGKLMKKDITATSRFFIPMIIAHVVASILGKILLEISLKNQYMFFTHKAFYNALSIFSFIYIGLFILFFVAYYVTTSVFIVYDFYKTMNSDQAYLTHTLPVKANTLIISKTLTAIIWEAVTGSIIILSFFLLIAGHVSDLEIREILLSMTDTLGMPVTFFAFYMAISIILGAISGPLMFFASIAVGHLFGKHRVMAAIITYMAAYAVLQTLNTVVMSLMGYNLNSYFNIVVGNFFNRFIWYVIIQGVTTILLFYFTTDFIFSKKLNLE